MSLLQWEFGAPIAYTLSNSLTMSLCSPPGQRSLETDSESSVENSDEERPEKCYAEQNV